MEGEMDTGVAGRGRYSGVGTFATLETSVCRGGFSVATFGTGCTVSLLREGVCFPTSCDLFNRSAASKGSTMLGNRGSDEVEKSYTGFCGEVVWVARGETLVCREGVWVATLGTGFCGGRGSVARGETSVCGERVWVATLGTGFCGGLVSASGEVVVRQG
jgi:hypothetical protein